MRVFAKATDKKSLPTSGILFYARRISLYAAAIATVVAVAGVIAQPARSGELSVSPAEDEMRILRDQLQRQQTGAEPNAPGELRGPYQRPHHGNAYHKRMN
jgi:hypothetical protein